MFASGLIMTVISIAGCGHTCESNNHIFTAVNDGNGKVIRLNTITGETCVVGESCNNMVVGDSYVYKGNGQFQHEKTINFKSYERNISLHAKPVPNK